MAKQFVEETKRHKRYVAEGHTPAITTTLTATPSVYYSASNIVTPNL